MKALVVGAGAVGQVYGLFLHEGGAEVTFLVKPKYHHILKQGLKFFPLNQGRSPLAHTFSGYQIISELNLLAKEQWDVVIITLPSDAIYTPWTAQFAAYINQEATIVSLQPGLSDRQELEKYFASERIISGMIGLIAFATPLDPQGPQEQGMAFWLPPLMKAPFDGDEERLKVLLSVFNKGGLPVTHRKLLTHPAPVAYGSTFLSVFIRVLELQQWKLAALNKPEVLKLLIAASLEALEVVRRKLSLKRPWFRVFLNPFFIRSGLAVAAKVLPFDLEIYLRVHFTKVGPQMHRNLQQVIDLGESYGLTLYHLSRLKIPK